MINLLQDPIPKPLLWAGVPIAALILIVLFSFLRFPYDDFRQPLSNQLQRITQGEVQIGGIEPTLGWTGPGMAALDINLTQPGQPRIRIDRIEMRPSWSSGWFRMEPTIQLDLESPMASANGVLALGDTPGWSGQIDVPDLSVLPLPTQSTLGLTGSLHAEAELLLPNTGPSGPIRFEAVSGSFAHPEIPIPVQFDRLTGELQLGGQALVELKEVLLDGPIIAADVEGVILPGPGNSDPSLDMDVIVEVKSAPLKAMMRGMGLRLDRSGLTSFKLGGTLSRPIAR